jgi:hypothetical protein
MATETLDSRVRRLEQILATRGRHTDAASDESASAAALRHFSTTLQSIVPLTPEVRSRIGAGDWDAGDGLAARLLLDVLISALRSCRVVSDQATSRLHEVERAVKAGHKFLRREAAISKET